MRWLGVAGALLLPPLAVAALEIPNTFSAGDPISASQMNDNFQTVKAKVEELEGLLGTHATTEAWIAPTLLNGWTNYGQTWTTAAYRKDAHGVVHLKGLVQGGTVSAVLTLPAGYRPAQSRTLVTAGWQSSAPRTVGLEVTTSGSVRCDSTCTSASWISLDGVAFHAGE
jgi:hypothetical protein